MRPQKPSSIGAQHIQNISFDKVLRANVSMGAAATFASDGSPATFSQDNTDGVMIRVASNANPLGIVQFWSGSNTDTTVVHNLGRVPIGYYVTKKSKTCDVYDGSVLPTDANITLRCTDGSADTVVYIF
jgi:hypothetical protein